MFQRLNTSPGRIIGFRFSGTLTDEDYQTFVAEVGKTVADEGKIRLLLMMDYPQDLTLKAAWDNSIFWIRHIEDIERLAIVGQKPWERWIERIEQPFIKTEVRYYSKSHLKEAWTWLKS
jgi:hypothetical protein